MGQRVSIGLADRAYLATLRSSARLLGWRTGPPRRLWLA
jgi:hypothetical protein